MTEGARTLEQIRAAMFQHLTGRALKLSSNLLAASEDFSWDPHESDLASKLCSSRQEKSESELAARIGLPWIRNVHGFPDPAPV